MAENDGSLKDLYGKSSTFDLSDDDMRRIHEAADDALGRFSGSAHYLAVVESNRRLRVTMHAEERAIRRLTVWLVAFTIVLVLLTIVLVYLGVVDYKRHQTENNAATTSAGQVGAPYWHSLRP